MPFWSQWDKFDIPFRENWKVAPLLEVLIPQHEHTLELRHGWLEQGSDGLIDFSLVHQVFVPRI